MKKHRFLFLPLLVLIIFPGVRMKASVQFLDAGLSEIRDMAAREGKLYFAHFSADWCMPCQWMEENTFKDPKLAYFANKNYLATRLDIDHSEGKWYQDQYEVATLPTILIFSSQGVLLNRIESSMGADDLLTILEELNKPANKISVRPPEFVASTTPAMDSPKASFVFSKPALVPENNPTVSTNNQPVFAQQTAVNNRVYNEPPRRYPQNETLAFTPKSGSEYYIQTGIFNQYQPAVEQVHMLEKLFEQPVQLFTKREGEELHYYVTIGKFNSRSKAGSFLNFLLRNDIKGELKEK